MSWSFKIRDHRKKFSDHKISKIIENMQSSVKTDFLLIREYLIQRAE